MRPATGLKENDFNLQKGGTLDGPRRLPCCGRPFRSSPDRLSATPGTDSHDTARFLRYRVVDDEHVGFAAGVFAFRMTS